MGSPATVDIDWFLDHWCGRAESGVIHHDVEPFEAIYRGGHDRFDCIVIGQGIEATR